MKAWNHVTQFIHHSSISLESIDVIHWVYASWMKHIDCHCTYLYANKESLCRNTIPAHEDKHPDCRHVSSFIMVRTGIAVLDHLWFTSCFASRHPKQKLMLLWRLYEIRRKKKCVKVVIVDFERCSFFLNVAADLKWTFHINTCVISAKLIRRCFVSVLSSFNIFSWLNNSKFCGSLFSECALVRSISIWWLVKLGVLTSQFISINMLIKT